MNIGFRPTIGGTIKKIEVNLFDTDMDLYSKKLRVYVKRKLRDEVKFASLDELKQQLKKDKKEAEDLLMQ